MTPKPDISRDAWAAIKLLAFDVDGTLTDGSLTFDEQGHLYQTFNVRDGFALVAARRAGLIVAWISGRASPVAERRFAELDLHHCILACPDKAAAMRELQEKHNLTREECCFVGDDIPDLPAYAVCGLNVAVADAVPEVLSRAHFVTQANGGRGAAREVIEKVLGAQGHWDVLIDRLTQIDWSHHESENLQK